MSNVSILLKHVSSKMHASLCTKVHMADLVPCTFHDICNRIFLIDANVNLINIANILSYNE